MVKEHRPELTTAVFSTWLDNRTKLVGEDLSETGHFKLDYHFDGYEHDTINFPHDKDRLYIHKIDQYVVANASDCITENAPDLSWLYLQYTDDMGHLFGDSEKFYDAVEIADKQVGKIWEAILYRRKQFDENWEVFITTDHGRTKETGKGHGGQSERERQTWMVTNAQHLNDYFKKQQPGVVDIMPTILRNLKIEPKKEQLWEIDGVPLTDKISLANTKATSKNNKLHITWDVLDSNGKVKIWIAKENKFKINGSDTYKLLENVAVKNGQVDIDVTQLPSNFYKIVLEAKYNTTNTWIFTK